MRGLGAKGTMRSKGSIAGHLKALMRAQEIEQDIGPDTARIVHTFEDGWTIRQLLTYGDLQREGELMQNCLAAWGLTSEADHPLWHQHPGERGDPDYFSTPLPGGDYLYSLRDPDNLPHVSMDNDGMRGRANRSVKPEYLTRIREWAPQRRLPTPLAGELLEIATELQRDPEFAAILEVQRALGRRSGSPATDWEEGASSRAPYGGCYDPSRRPPGFPSP